MAGSINLQSAQYRGGFYMRYEQEFAKSWAPEVGVYYPSDKEIETYKMLGMVPPPRQWIGARQEKGLRQDSFTIRNVLYEDTLGFDNDDLRRDISGQINDRIGQLAQRFSNHWEQLSTTLINNGETGLAYDGQAYFAATHSSGSSGTWKNLLTNADISYLASTVAGKPTADEAAKQIMALCAYFFTYKDDQGEPINGSARNFLAMVNDVHVYAAWQTAVKASMLSQGATNPLIAGLSDFNIRVVFNPRLTTAATKVYLFRTDGLGQRPFILQEELGVQTDVIGLDSEYAKINRRQLFGASALRAAGYGMPQHAIKATLS